MAQFLRPDSDVAISSWAGTPTTSGIWQNIDEGTASDSDFIYSGNNPNGSGCEIGLGDPGATPGSGTCTVRFRRAQLNGTALSGTGTAVQFDVQILEGATLIASSGATTLSGAWTDQSFTFDASAVSNWNDLRLKFVATGGGGSPANRRGAGVSWAEVETPDAGGGSPQTITGTDHVSADSFGAGALATNYSITGAAHASADTFGAGTASPGPVTITGAAHTSADSFGAGTIGEPGSGVAIVASALVLNDFNDLTSYTSASQFTAEGGADHCIVALVSATQNSGTLAVYPNTTATYGGQAMTLAAAGNIGGSNEAGALIFYLMNPPTAAADTVVTFDGSGARACAITIVELAGVDTADPLGATAAATSGSTCQVGLTAQAADSVILSVSAARDGDSGPFTPTSDTTELQDYNNGTADFSSHAGMVGQKTGTAAGAAYTMGGTPTVTTTHEGAVAAEFKADAATRYIAAVEAADGEALESGVASAITAFIAGLKTDGLWAQIDQAAIMMGARSLSGALVPLKGGPPTNVNFVAGDYNRTGGLTGNGSTKRLTTDPPAYTQNDAHVSVRFGSSFTPAATGGLIGNSTTASGGSSLIYTTSVFGPRVTWTGSGANVSYAGAYSGFAGASRSGSAATDYRSSAGASSLTQTSAAPLAGGFNVFARGTIASPSDFSSAALTWFSHGRAITLADLDARLATLAAAIATALSGGGSPQTITGTDHTAADSFGAGAVAPGSVTITGSAHAAADSFGVGSVATAYTVTGATHGSADSFGAGAVAADYTITGSAHTGADAFGAGTLSPGPVTITGAAHSSADSFGAGTIGDGAWSPSDLTLLAWMNTGDLGTTWQDTGAATPAGIGDDLARIDNKVVSGLWYGQSNAANRPTLTAGGADFNGTSDSLVSNQAVDLSSTDKITFFCVVESDADADGMIAELGAANGAARFFVIRANTVSDQTYGSASRGSASVSADQRADTGASYPATNLVALIIEHDIPGDLTRIFADGTLDGTATGDKGTGNFASNLELYFGARAGSSLFFDGRIAESFVASGIVGATDRQSALDYFASAWGTGGGSGAQTITGAAHAGADTFGAGTLAPGLATISGAAHASADTFGTGAISASYTISGSAHASSDSFGTGAVAASYTITGAAHASADTFGAGTASPGPVTITGAAHSTADLFGAGIVGQEGGPQYVGGAAHSAPDSFGAGVLSAGAVAITGAAHGSTDTFGAGAVATSYTILCATHGSADSFGAGSVAPGAVTIAGAAHASADAFGAGAIATRHSITGTAFSTADLFGSGSLSIGLVGSEHAFATELIWDTPPASLRWNPASAALDFAGAETNLDWGEET